jgi:ATP-dependent DNA ligase
MLAAPAREIPDGPGWLYEPKWDGFRAIVFRDGTATLIQSRDLKPLDRYFPELAEPLVRSLPARCVVDGEIVIARRPSAGAPIVLDFDALLQRIHPAASRVAMLGRETPASFVAWDLLALDGDDLRDRPLAERRRLLEAAMAEAVPPVHLTPVTTDPAVAADWFRRFEGAGLDGVIAKRADGPYEPGKRAMVKVKHARTADCVVGGFRWHKDGPGTWVGSLLLGLHDDAGALHHVGVASGFSRERRAAFAAELAPLALAEDAAHPWIPRDADGAPIRIPGGESRWSRGRSLDWVPLAPDRVVEVAYDHLQGDRFRHATSFVRWRDDRLPDGCRYDQLEVTPARELDEVFRAGGPADSGGSRDERPVTDR